MYNLKVSEYIKNNMKANDITYKELEEKSGVPSSTIYAYAKATVATPNEENLIRIAAVFGDSPDAIRQMRIESREAQEKERRLIEGAEDQERMRQLAELIRTSVSTLLDDYRAQASAQQTELLQYAEQRIKEESQRADDSIKKAEADFNRRVQEVLKQCNDEINRNKIVCQSEISLEKKHCQDKIDIIQKACNERISDLKDHLERVTHLEGQHGAEMRGRNDKSTEYLKSCVRNLSGVSIILGLTSLFFGAYAIYAYTVFDMNDLTRGLHQRDHSIGPIILAISIALIAAAMYRIFILFLNRPSKQKK